MMRYQRSQNKIKGPLHVIKLHDKKITVTLQYDSPQKIQKTIKNKTIFLRQLSQKQKLEYAHFKKIRKFSNQYEKNKNSLKKKQPYFYVQNINQCCLLLNEYQKFHKRLIEGQTQSRKMTVYSNSKQLKAVKMKSKAPIMQTIEAKNSPKLQIPIRKIKLYSPAKKKSTNNKQNLSNSIIDIKLKSENQKNKKYKGTPNRKREYKLFVTSSKSKNKYDSLLSNREDQSLQISKINRVKHNQQTPQANLKSFNSLSFNQK